MRLRLLLVAIALCAIAYPIVRAFQHVGSPGYPTDYVAALKTHTGVPVESAHFEPFIGFVTHMSAPDWEAHLEPVYADNLHFSDTLAVLDDRAALHRYFEQLHRAGTRTEVEILSRHASGQDGYLVWRMTSTFKPLNTERTSHSIGVTHLRFNEQGRVILHQDFWDAAQGFYRHIPGLGGVIDGIRNRLGPGADETG